MSSLYSKLRGRAAQAHQRCIARIKSEMAFTARQISDIHRLVGGLCRRRAPDELKDKIRLGYVIENNKIVIIEARPWREPSSEWLEMEIGKLRYVAQRKE